MDEVVLVHVNEPQHDLAEEPARLALRETRVDVAHGRGVDAAREVEEQVAALEVLRHEEHVGRRLEGREAALQEPRRRDLDAGKEDTTARRRTTVRHAWMHARMAALND